MKRTLIYLTITVALLALITTVLMFSSSGTAPINLYWGIDCEGENNCTLYVSGISLLPEDENGNILEEENTFIANGMFTPAQANGFDDVSDNPWYPYRKQITNVELGAEDDVIVPQNMYGWFYGMDKLTNIDFSYVDSSSITSASYLFYGCSSLRNLDLSPLRIIGKVAGVSEEVYSYTYLDSVKLSANNYLFFEYGLWKNENTDAVTYYTETPTGEAVTYTNVTPKFYYNIDNGVLTITSTETPGYDWNYEGAKNKWFDMYTEELTDNITSVEIKDFNPKIMYRLFADLTNVTSITFENVDTSNTIDMTELFSNCKKITTLDLSEISTEGITVGEVNDNVASDLFLNCTALKQVTINNKFGYSLSEGVWTNTIGTIFKNGIIKANVNETYTRQAIYWSVSGDTLTISNNFVSGSHFGAFDYTDEAALDNIPWAEYKNTVKHVNIGAENSKVAPISMNNWFLNFSKVETIDLQYIDASSLRTMVSTFEGMTSLKSIDLSVLNLESLGSVDYIFSGCTSLTSVNLENFNSPIIDSIAGMFIGCTSLEKVDLSSLTTDSLVYVYDLFNGCTNLREINIGNLDLTGVDTNFPEDYENLFFGCNKISKITIGPKNAAIVKEQLGNPSSEYIEGADGKWYDVNFTAYDVTELSETNITTYFATSPKTINIYNSETNQLILTDTQPYGTKIRLNVNASKANSTSNIAVSYESEGNVTFPDSTATKTTTYKLVGYTDNTNTYEYNGEYTVTADKDLYTVFEPDQETTSSIDLPDATRFGYTFKGWSVDKTSTSGLIGAYTPEANIKLYAIWEEIKHNYLDNTATNKLVIGRTKSLVLRIDAPLERFKDLFVGTNKLTKDTHYTATSGSTVITFTETGMNYLESLGPGTYEIIAEFDDTISGSVANLTVEEVGKHVLTIHYKYSGNRSSESVFEDYNKSIAEDETYNVESPTKAGYTADQTVITGTMGKQNIEVTVTYTPVNDKNNNGVADEEEPKEITNETEDIVPSPKTSDNIISYFILEIISLVAAVIIFIRIKAQ